MAKSLAKYEPALKYGALLSAKVVTATGAALAATCSAPAGVVTTEALTTAAGAEQTYVITNTRVKATDIVLVQAGNGTNTTVAPQVCSVTPTANTSTVVFTNVHAASALNGTITLSFVIIRPA